MKGKIIIAAAVVVVLLLVAVVVATSNLGKIVKFGVEKGGTLVLGVPTQLERATVSVRNGTVGLDGLTIGSPQGFKEPTMFELGRMQATVDIGSLRKEEIVVREVVIDGAKITLEFAGGKTNWGTVLKRLEGEPKDEEAKQESQKKIRIGRIVFSNGEVRIAGIPLAGSATVPLPTLEITDLASADGTPQTVGKVLANVIRSLHKAILAAAGDVLPVERLQTLRQEALSAVNDAGEAVREAAAGAAKDAAERAKGVLSGILPGRKEPEGQ